MSTKDRNNIILAAYGLINKDRPIKIVVNRGLKKAEVINFEAFKLAKEWGITYSEALKCCLHY